MSDQYGGQDRQEERADTSARVISWAAKYGAADNDCYHALE